MPIKSALFQSLDYGLHHSYDMARKKTKLLSPVKHTLSSRRVWCFRLIAMLGVPVFLFCAIELALRVAGVGYPTSFLLPSMNQGQKTYIQNDQFGWRFFGAQMARQPHAISITQEKPPGTIRIFVFGESAAFGDPQPRYGLARLILAMLELRHPGINFEVVNAAMTGINSHAILPIARDCAKAGGDIWVIYMGNNEVVGPYGAGTVFGPQVLPLPLIRASLMAKATRSGQLIDSLMANLRPPPPSRSEWGGMMMFLDQQVAANDPRMAGVYKHFASNLNDILAAGARGGAKIVLSTVAVNLKDCAPFASLHRAGLSADQTNDWAANYQRGLKLYKNGQMPEAEVAFQAAANIDDAYAELRFCLGQCALTLGRAEEARKQFSAARDLDALRFRCDSRLNELTREAARKHASDGVRLADTDLAFAAASPNGLPGSGLFYEHVHLTFQGNYLLARTLVEQMEPMLPATLGTTAQPWPDIAACAHRLAFTGRETQQALSEVLGRSMDPPYTWQLNHTDLVAQLQQQIHNYPPMESPAALKESLVACETAVAEVTNDALLYQQLADLKQALADYPGAVAAAQRSLDFLPSNTEVSLQLGLALAQEQKYEAAATAFNRCYAANPEDVWALHNLALCYEKMGQSDTAIREFKRAVSIKPRFGVAWLALGQLYENLGRTNDASECYQKALANPLHRAAELTMLAQFCQNRHWYSAAFTNYSEAINLDPTDARLHFNLALVLQAMSRHAEAAQAFAEATRLAPDLAQAYFLGGMEYGRINNNAGAEQAFREAARLMPNVLEARLNLAITLYREGKLKEARQIFQTAQQQDPANATAAKFLQLIQQQTSAGAGN